MRMKTLVFSGKQTPVNHPQTRISNGTLTFPEEHSLHSLDFAGLGYWGSIRSETKFVGMRLEYPPPESYHRGLMKISLFPQLYLRWPPNPPPKKLQRFTSRTVLRSLTGIVTKLEVPKLSKFPGPVSCSLNTLVSINLVVSNGMAIVLRHWKEVAENGLLFIKTGSHSLITNLTRPISTAGLTTSKSSVSPSLISKRIFQGGTPGIRSAIPGQTPIMSPRLFRLTNYLFFLRMVH